MGNIRHFAPKNFLWRECFFLTWPQWHEHTFKVTTNKHKFLLVNDVIVSAYRYIAITTLAIIAVSLEYLRQFLIDLHKTYRRSSVP